MKCKTMSHVSRLTGFTLIELLISVAIIGILILTTLSLYNLQLRKGRDSRRKADLAKIQKVLEDYLTLIFSKDFHRKAKQHGGLEVMHDSSSGGADFILRLDQKKKIIIEVAFGKQNDGIKQIENTGKITADYDYGIIISRHGDLEVVNDKIIKIPLKHWLAI